MSGKQAAVSEHLKGGGVKRTKEGFLISRVLEGPAFRICLWDATIESFTREEGNRQSDREAASSRDDHRHTAAPNRFSYDLIGTMFSSFEKLKVPILHGKAAAGRWPAGGVTAASDASQSRFHPLLSA